MNGTQTSRSNLVVAFLLTGLLVAAGLTLAACGGGNAPNTSSTSSFSITDLHTGIAVEGEKPNITNPSETVDVSTTLNLPDMTGQPPGYSYVYTDVNQPEWYLGMYASSVEWANSDTGEEFFADDWYQGEQGWVVHDWTTEELAGMNDSGAYPAWDALMTDPSTGHILEVCKIVVNGKDVGWEGEYEYRDASEFNSNDTNANRLPPDSITPP